MKDIRWINISIILLSTCSGVIGQLFLKKGVSNFSLDLSNLFMTFKGAITNLYLLSAVLWILVVSRFELSFAFPAVMSLSYVLIVLFSGWLFGETISIARWIGVIVLCLGIFLVSK